MTAPDTDAPVPVEVGAEMIKQFKVGFHGSTLDDGQVRRGLEFVFAGRGLFDPGAPMASGEPPMTAAEDVLAWLLIERIGAPDDVPYSPDDAQRIIEDRLSQQTSFLARAEKAERERDALAAECERLRGKVAALKIADEAIAEYFRYFDGGESRGSYDGKPERNALRRAGYATCAALSQVREGE